MLQHALLALALLQAAPPAPPPIQAPAAQAPAQDDPLTLPPIVYPADAQAAHIQGVVRLEVDVDPTGKVTAVRAIDGPEQLRKAAVDAYSQATYRPHTKDNVAIPTTIPAEVNFTLTEAPADLDVQVSAKFQVQHARCQILAASHQQTALATCRQALELAKQFSPGAQLDVRATAYNDLVLLLIADGKKSPNLEEAGLLANEAVTMVDEAVHTDPHKPAVAIAYITRAEVRSLADQLPGAIADCAVAEEILTTLLADKGNKSANPLDNVESERVGSYRAQLRDVLQLHAVILDRQKKSKEAKEMRHRAESV
jgi:TonB family protein